MTGSEDANMIESKLDLFLKAIDSLSMRTNVLEDFATQARVVEASQPMQTASTSRTSLPSQNYNSNISTTKEPWISLPEKFDGSRSKLLGVCESSPIHHRLPSLTIFSR